MWPSGARRQRRSKRNATGVQIVDHEMTSFRTAYYSYLQEFNRGHGTDFTMRPPAPTYYGDTWFILRSAKLPNAAQIRHMPQAGNIELKDTNVSKVTDLSALLDKDMELISNGKYKQHATIRSKALKIDFARDRPKVESALLLAERFWQLVQQERLHVDKILAFARSG
jgi:hypothetical protein